jgi:hypothetical protein
MKLITEEIENVEVIVEHVNGKKNLYIEGIFLQGDLPNRNKRMYEMDTLREGVRNYTDRYLSKGRAVGELGHPCLSGDAKLLSVNDGWKHIQDCNENELVYTLNPETKFVEIQPIKKVVINDHSGIMYTLKNRGIHTKITPDHRFLIINSRNNKDYKYVTAQEIYEDLNSENNFSKWFIPKYSLGLDKETPDKYTIPKSSTIKRITESTKKYLEDLDVEFNTFCAFLGIYLSEGNCSIQKNGSYNIGICQKIGNKSDKISEILHTMEGLTWNESFVGDKIIWTCYDRRLGEYLYQFGNCYDKYVPRDFITSLNSDSARIFIEYFVLGDGRGELSHSYSRCDCFSTSKKLIDDIAQIATIAGISVATFEEVTENDYVFAERVIKAENKNTLYFCRFLTTKGVYLDKRFMQMDIEDWNDKVYCIQVENTNFMVEQNGYTYWTGNCGPTINLDRVSHNIISLKESGSNFMGKAKILTSLPMGKIAAGLYEEGVKLGVSSRGVGSLIPTDKGYSLVGRDFMISTAADIVHDPSAPDAFVNGIMEGVSWLYDSKKQVWVSEQIKNKIENDVFSRRLTEERKLQHFENYLRLI